MSELESSSGPTVTTVGPRSYIEYRESKPRRFVYIQDGDLDRWMRCLEGLPQTRFGLRELAYCAIGVGVPEGINAFVALPARGQSPTTGFVVHLVVAVLFSLASVVCFLADSRIAHVTSVSWTALLRDMKDVAERSEHSEEKPSEND